MKILVAIGMLLLIGSLFAGRYLMNYCSNEFYTPAALLSIWIVRGISYLLMILPFKE